MCFKNANRLIVIGLLALVSGCASVSEVAIPDEGVKTGSLDEAVAVFRRAENMGAEGAAPKTYQKALQALNHMNSVIQLEPGNEEAIQEAAKHFAFEAEHLFHITHEVNELRSVQSQAVENIVLSAEYRLLAISDALKQPDPRREKLFDQAVTIANAAKNIVSSEDKTDARAVYKRRINKNELDDAYTKIKQLELQLKSLRDDNSQLKTDQKPLNKRIESLERLVLELTEKNTSLVDTIRELKGKLNKPKPPAG